MIWLRFAPYVGILLIAGYAIYQRGEANAARLERAAVEQSLETALEANRSQQIAIDQMTIMREQTANIMLELGDRLDQINNAVIDGNKELAELKETDETTRGYLGGLVPSELKRLLNK